MCYCSRILWSKLHVLLHCQFARFIKIHTKMGEFTLTYRLDRQLHAHTHIFMYININLKQLYIFLRPTQIYYLSFYSVLTNLLQFHEITIVTNRQKINKHKSLSFQF